MEQLLSHLRACAEPTRLRLLALAARGSFCVTDFCEILDQSQPRLSRHLRLLTDSGLLERLREGPIVWLALPGAGTPAGSLARALLARLPLDDAVLSDDRRQAARVLAERARVASESFRARGAEWEEMQALGLPAEAVQRALLGLLPEQPEARVLDIGTGTGRLLEVLAPRVAVAVGVDASRAMLALARARLARPDPTAADLGHCSVRLADMYRLPFSGDAFDWVAMQMVLHHAEDPPAALAEAARVLRPGGRLVVVVLDGHADSEVVRRFAHRWAGFDAAHMRALLASAGLVVAASERVAGPLDVCVWAADSPALAAAAVSHEILEETP